MRTTARFALGLVVLLLAAVVAPRPAGPLLTSAGAAIQPTPTIPDLFGTPTPRPRPTETQDPGDPDPGDPGDPGEPGGGDGDGGKDGKGSDKDDKDGKGGARSDRGRNGGGPDGRGRKRKKDEPSIFVGTFRPSGPQGAFDTDRLVAAATQLRSLGWSEGDVLSGVYPPFIIAGPAAWTNTWGAPRFGPGPLVRTHEGQDVFCSFGDPVIAAEAGRVSFSDGGLGGLVARLHRPDGSYWYYAHLSGLNPDLRGGDSVRRGELLGFCGNSGNALTTPPHVHFGWYGANGTARNPMAQLIDWLESAEERAGRLVEAALGERVRKQEKGTLTTARRFGDALVPGVAELRISTESLWASGSSPASGAFGLAEMAIQAALANRVAADVYRPTGADITTESSLDPDSALAEVLRTRNRDPSGELGD